MRKLSSLLASTLIATLLVAGPPFAQTALATCSNCAEVFDGTTYTGALKDFAQGSGIADLAASGWNDRISSMHVKEPLGHGFVWWTGANFTGSSFKTCGIDDLPTLTLNNQISSYESTTLCPS